MENGIGNPLKPSITPLFDFISHIQGLPSRTVVRQLLSECLDSTWPTKQFDQDDPQSYDEGLVALDNIIMVLHHLQQRLSIRRNAMASFIRKLPDDLLLEVFLHLGLNVKDKIAVAQTCARWRKLSLQSPCLWTSLDLSSLPARILGTTLERSEGLPLTITCSTSNMHLDQVLPSALHRIRILDLKLQNPSKDYQESCPDWLGPNSPSTTVDDLRITSHYREVHLPHDLLQHYPRLTKLSLTNCRMSFSPGVYTNLKKLHIQQFGRVHTYHADVDLLHVFVDSPELEDVALVGCSAVGSHPWDNQFGTLPLLHLRRMYLKLTPLCLRRIMSSVVASPNLESIRIISTPAPNGRHDPLTFVSANSLLSPFLRDAKSLSIDTRHGQLGMIGYMDPDMEKQTFEIRDSDMLAEASSFLSSLLKFYPMPSVRRIRIKVVHDSYEAIMILLNNLRSVRQLDLDFEDTVSSFIPSSGIGCGVLFSVLCNPHIVEPHTTSAPISPVCSDLEVLCLDSVVITKHDVEEICKWAERHPRLSNLRLGHRCHFVADDMTMLDSQAEEELMVALKKRFKNVINYIALFDNVDDQLSCHCPDIKPISPVSSSMTITSNSACPSS